MDKLHFDDCAAIDRRQDVKTSIRGPAGLFACLVLVLGGACVAVEGPGASEPLVDDDDVDFRADGCGAGKKKADVEMTCNYKARAVKGGANNPDRFIEIQQSVCLGDDKIKCYFRYEGCVVEAINFQDTPCASVPPGVTNPWCPAADNTYPMLGLEKTYDLPEGDTTCDPELPGATKAFCAAKVTGQDSTIRDALYAMCTEIQYDRPHTHQCCVKKTGGGTTGDESGDCGSGTMSESTGPEWTSGASLESASVGGSGPSGATSEDSSGGWSGSSG